MSSSNYESTDTTSLDSFLASTGHPRVTSRWSSTIAVEQAHDVNDLEMAVKLEEERNTKRERPTAPTAAAYDASESVVQKQIRITNENLHRCEWCQSYAVFDKTIPSHLGNLDDAAIEIPFFQYEGENNAHLRAHIAINHPNIFKQGRERYHKYVEFLRARDYALELNRDSQRLGKDNPDRQAELDIKIRKLLREVVETLQDPQMKKIILHQDSKRQER